MKLALTSTLIVFDFMISIRCDKKVPSFPQDVHGHACMQDSSRTEAQNKESLLKTDDDNDDAEPLRQIHAPFHTV